MGNTAEAKAEARSTEPDDTEMYAPPPAYTPYNGGAGTGAPSSSVVMRREAETPRAPINMSTSTSPYHAFPPSLNLHYQHWKLSRTFHLGDILNHKLYAVSSYAGFTGRFIGRGPGVHCIILHNGPSDKDEALAVAGEEKNWTVSSRTTFVSLPPLNAPTTGAGAGVGTTSGQAQGTHTVTEIMHGETSLGQSAITFRFSVEVNQPKDDSGGRGLHREDFEWRAMDSDELDGFKGGFRLFRMGPGAFPRACCGHCDCSSSGGLHGESSQAKRDVEVVASTVFKGAMNMNKPLNVDFVGSGLTGELGNRWAVMVIITAVRLWYLDIQGRTR